MMTATWASLVRNLKALLSPVVVEGLDKLNLWRELGFDVLVQDPKKHVTDRQMEAQHGSGGGVQVSVHCSTVAATRKRSDCRGPLHIPVVHAAVVCM
mmetsp:Transcript_2014/g.4080  ORF Transcript_2014/g.4080 Transcript_2014/m.4080 type:complete len:97 (+) Transcript_2014:277-567(+)